MLKSDLCKVSCVFVILFFSIEVFSAEDSTWRDENALLREMIFTSLGKLPFVNKQQELSVEDIHEALILSCMHKADCTRDELNDLRAGKQPQDVGAKKGLSNAQMIFGRKLVTVSRESGE
jgi:hypothetical protein